MYIHDDNLLNLSFTCVYLIRLMVDVCFMSSGMVNKIKYILFSCCFINLKGLKNLKSDWKYISLWIIFDSYLPNKSHVASIQHDIHLLIPRNSKSVTPNTSNIKKHYKKFSNSKRIRPAILTHLKSDTSWRYTLYKERGDPIDIRHSTTLR